MPADVYYAPHPRCPTHGQMSWQGYATGLWVCHGFDGEGCCEHTVSHDEMGWTLVGVQARTRLAADGTPPSR
jgi:hypothetical protein